MLRTVLAVVTLALMLPVSALAGLTRAESALLHEMNRARAQHGLGTLTYDPRLERAAHAHTRTMLSSNVFAHGAFASRMLQFDVTGSVAGENLAWGTGSEGSARALVAAWLASPEHRANLLAPAFRRVGVGALVGRFQGYAGARVVTADFAGCPATRARASRATRSASRVEDRRARRARPAPSDPGRAVRARPG